LDSGNHQINEVCYDKFSAHQFSTRMMEEGFPMVEVGATVGNFSEPTKKLEALIAEGKIHHNGDPVLGWEISNVVGHYDRKENVYPVKERPENKIDGAIALIMALNRALIRGSANVEPLYQVFFI
jgi:phage terminase large subunit-like protein